MGELPPNLCELGFEFLFVSPVLLPHRSGFTESLNEWVVSHWQALVVDGRWILTCKQLCKHLEPLGVPFDAPTERVPIHVQISKRIRSADLH